MADVFDSALASETPAVSLPGRVLAIARDYEDVHAAFRARAEELNISRETLDAVSGLQPGYSGKMLAPTPMKRAGPITLPLLLVGLGLALAVVEDTEAFERVESRLIQRNRWPRADLKAAEADAVNLRHKVVVELGRRGAKAANKKRSRKLRRRIARKAARARWARKRR
jgi:hypothetical protein